MSNEKNDKVATTNTVDCHAIQYKMKRSILQFGENCFDDCMPEEIDGAIENFKGDFEHNRSGIKIIGYGLYDKDEINDAASDTVERLLERIGLYVDIEEVETGEEARLWPTQVIMSTGEEGFYRWVWNFTEVEDDWGCTLKSEGVIEVVSQKKE